VINVAVVDDDRMLLDGIRAWFGSVGDLDLRAVTHTVDELLDLFAAGRPRADVVVLDLLLADGSDPVDNVTRLVEQGFRVLVVSVAPRTEHGIDVVRAGAAGYLTKDHDLGTLTEAVREVAARNVTHSPELAFAWSRDRRPDRPHLSAQERAILKAYASGMTLTAAARRAGVQPATAKKYLDRVKEKYVRVGRPAYTKLDLANRVREDGLLRYPD
jgi:two-component system nitrate/nitrite response regulator NarL